MQDEKICKKCNKTLYTLAVNDYAPELIKLTFPFMKRYADKIGANFQVIKDRKYPDLPPVYEKFQIYDLAKKNGDEWSLYFDADVLIHPDFWDITATLSKDTTISGYQNDFTPQRFKLDEYFLRDGRFIGKGNWILAASEWCRDIWHPLDDITPKEAIKRITPIENENNTIVAAEHLIDDYVVSRNIARYGLKHTLLSDEMKKFNTPNPVSFLYHNYTISNIQKRAEMCQYIATWAGDIYVNRLPQGGFVAKPFIKANTPEECNAEVIRKTQELVDSWLGEKNIEGLKIQIINPSAPISSTSVPLGNTAPFEIVNGKVEVKK